MQENLPDLGTSRVVSWPNKTNKASTRVCVSLSTEPLITCGEFGFMERIDSPLSEARYLDRCDVPLVTVDFASSSSWTNECWLYTLTVLTGRYSTHLSWPTRVPVNNHLSLHGHTNHPIMIKSWFYFTIYNMNHMNDARSLSDASLVLLIPVRYDVQRPSPYKDTDLCSLSETKQNDLDQLYFR
jgi:hypothetical protein